jgi:AcrR family transcriptional regulator
MEAVSGCTGPRETVSICQPFAMPTKRPKLTARKPRADAQRNRERILEVAKEAFTRHGASTSLDDVAKQAAVGPGTLYRHFPTREALLEAVYTTEVAKLAAAEQKFAATMAPVEALRAWMHLFIDYIAAKQIIQPALVALVGSAKPKFVEAAYAQVHQAVRALVKRAIDNGDLRPDIDAVDLLRALVGVSSLSNSPDWKQSAIRLVDILIAGSRPERS